MSSHQANGYRQKHACSENNETTSVMKPYRTSVLRERCSDESFGTRSFPGLKRSLSEFQTNHDSAQIDSAAPAVFSDVPFHNPDKHKFQHTLAIIKPEAVRLMYKIETILAKNEFIIIAKDVLRLTQEQAAEFYSQYSLEPFFPRLVSHMASGPIVVYVLAKRDGVNEWRRLIGPADVSVAKTNFPISLRAIYGTRSVAGPITNAFHGSDSPGAARREIQFFFPKSQAAFANNNDNEVQQYIQEFMMPVIRVGLSEMFRTDPADPLRWFGNWILNIN